MSQTTHRAEIFATFVIRFSIYTYMLTKRYEQEAYHAPEFEVLATEVEQGFALSNLEDPVEKPEQSW